MKWPWQKAPENRGTLTLLPDGVFIFGLPHGVPEDLADVAMRHLRQWADSPSPAKGLVFPFPVDVEDRRR